MLCLRQSAYVQFAAILLYPHRPTNTPWLVFLPGNSISGSRGKDQKDHSAGRQELPHPHPALWLVPVGPDGPSAGWQPWVIHPNPLALFSSSAPIVRPSKTVGRIK